jgi:hypothetical protein
LAIIEYVLYVKIFTVILSIFFSPYSSVFIILLTVN